MYKYAFSLLFAVLFAATGFAQNSYNYGYPAENVTEEGNPTDNEPWVIRGLGSSKSTGYNYALLQMPANVCNTLQGTKITKIAFYTFMTSQTTAKVIITNEIGGTPLFEQEVEIGEKQWNEVTLTSPYTIQPDEDIYIGYAIKTESGDYPIGYYCTSQVMAAATIDPILDYWGYDTTSGAVSDMLDVQMWASKRQTANFMLYATLENENGLPQNAVSMGATSLSTDVYVKSGDEVVFTGLYNNTAVADLTSFHLTMMFDGKTVSDGDITCNLKPFEEGKFSVQLPTTAIGLHHIEVILSKPNGQDNTFTGANSNGKKYLVYDQTAKRNVLLEHFTTGQCINCVAGEEKVEEELAKVDDDINVIRINHHSGYDTDKLTTEDDKAYVWFYGETYVWAPANMIDRTDLADYGATGYGGTATLGPVFGTDKSSAISELITSASSLPCFVTLDVASTIDDNRLLTVDVTANELYEMPQQDLMRLNVVLVEDSVKAAQTLADQTVDKSFIHYNVNRVNLTGTWGEVPEFENGELHKTFTYTVPTKYNLDNLRIVAFLADYDATNTKNCRVYNVNEAKVGENSADGIKSLTPTLSQGEGVIYNLSGQKLTEPQKGINIINGKKVVVK